MSLENIQYLKRMIGIVFGTKLDGREIQLICDYLDCAYTRGSIDELKNYDRRLAHPPKGSDYEDFDARR